MMLPPIRDWDAAYANGAHIPGGDRYGARWAASAARFREAARGELHIPYGAHGRERLDLFRPEEEPRGVVVFVHGGYWVALGREDWSHVARGAVERGWAVAVPSYPLAPNARVADITRSIARAVDAAAERVAGPVRLVGHSAGGHLVARMACTDVALECAARLERVVSVSGLHDLRPLLRVGENDAIGLDADEAWRESPAFREPRPGTRLVCWVGATERAEFVRQNDLLANIWRGMGAATAAVHEPDRHHFDVVDGLEHPTSPLTAALLEAP